VNGTSRTGQFPLPFDARPSLGGEDYLVSSCNSAAVAWIDRWPDWPGPSLAIAGARASGKTHLASVFAARCEARPLSVIELCATPASELAAPATPLVFDDAEAVAGRDDAEQALFHLLNALVGMKGRLLLTAALPPARWPVRLRDLASRLAAIPVAEIGAPDDALMGALLVKLYADRQLQVAADVVAYMVSRMERSFDAARSLVAAIDARAMAERRSITIPLVRAVMDGAGR
jgi:chromosomal replication initiation ATPase DnaA